MPDYPLRRDMLGAPLQMENGALKAPEFPRLGVSLIPEVEERYTFREDAVYTCLEDTTLLPDESVW